MDFRVGDKVRVKGNNLRKRTMYLDGIRWLAGTKCKVVSNLGLGYYLCIMLSDTKKAQSIHENELELVDN